MKKHTVTLFALAALAAAGCTKEEWPERPTTVMQETVSTTLYYSIDGEMHEAHVRNEAERHSLMVWLTAMAREGHTVKVGHSSNLSATAKETVTYTTTDKDKASQWAEDMFNNGYEVIINYDSDHGIYTCIATR